MKLPENEVIINAPWGKIAGLTWGDSSNPPVVLCHGQLDVSSGFRPLVSRLPTNFFYVSVDLPGNGKSDHFPRGSRFTIVDFVPTILRIQQHFNWNKFVYIGHSLGAVIGKYFNIAYPGNITRMVELDPVPNVEISEPNAFADWYHLFYGDFYSEDRYKKWNNSTETAPKYTYEKAMDLVTNTRGLTRESAEHVLERSLEPVGDGLYRFTYDQRLKDIPRLPLSRSYFEELYAAIETPTIAVLSRSCIKAGAYRDFVPFSNNPKWWPNKHYGILIVDGGHDVHLNNPERISGFIATFLLKFHRAKL